MPDSELVLEEGQKLVIKVGDEPKLEVGPTGVVAPDLAAVTDWPDITNKPAEFAPTSHDHPELPTTGQKNALVGSNGTPGTNNVFVTNSDPRLSDARTPVAHTHTRAQITDFAHTHPVSEITGLGSADSIARKTSDQASVSTTLANTTELSFPVAQGVAYRFEAYLLYRTAALTTGIRIGATCPAFNVYAANVRIAGFAVDGVGAEFLGSLTTSGDSVLTTAVIAANTDFIAVVEGVILPSANGTFQLQHATEVAASAATIRNGSHLAYRAL